MDVALARVMKNLLLVDDEENVLVGMGRYFRLAGFHVDCARDREEAEALLSRTSYDAAIVDLCLSPGHGPEGMEIIGRVRARCPASRIVVLTAFGSAESQAEAQRRGADLCMQKPRPLLEIHQELRKLLEPTEVTGRQ
jgi:two-component system OmpR family response regulator